MGLSTNSEDIDALAIAPDGRLILSTRGNFQVAGAGTNVAGVDEDLIVFNASSFGDMTSGTFEVYFDGSNVDLGRHGRGYQRCLAGWHDG